MIGLTGAVDWARAVSVICSAPPLEPSSYGGQEVPMSGVTAGGLRAALGGELGKADAARLAAGLRERIGAEALVKGSGFADELDAAWAIEAPGAPTAPVVVAELGAAFRLAMRPLG